MVRPHQDRPERVVPHGHRPGGDGVGPAQVAQDLLVGRGGERIGHGHSSGLDKILLRQ